MRTLILALLLAPPALAALKVDGKPKVAFFAVGNPGFLDIEGESADLACADDGTTLTCDHALDTLDTGIGLRDEHMKTKFLQTEKHPKASIALAKASIPWPAEVGKEARGSVAATFTAHGVSQPATVNYVVKKSKTGWRVTAKFDFDISKHGIEVPSYLGVTVESTMRAEVSFDLVDAP
ncbi:MAG: YceI family protein [Deltaproteobacteria bacterium]|nr:YceI family protein [Deltaproteobacteria bacterium]MBM4390194.1 YceI family protein [Deltaproteobacteria bacterium]